ncbi:MAG: polysaccharide deacetylase family protein, partial [Azoarcus sp.]|nr:polysaccharide deacetylase family protein [Azoarcus sp.]
MEYKAVLKSLAGQAYLTFGQGRLALRRHGVILMLHRVLADDREAVWPHRNSLCVGRQAFAHFLRWLRRNFECVTLSQLMEQPRTPRPRVTLTFDDGWRDVYDNAFPLLCRYRVPASVFLTTDFVGTSQRFWWDMVAETLWLVPQSAAADYLRSVMRVRGHPVPAELFEPEKSEARSIGIARYVNSLKKQPPTELNSLSDLLRPPSRPNALDWKQVRQMEDSGLVRFGSHGATHAILTHLDDKEAMGEILRAHIATKKHCRHPLRVFSYPNGDYDERVRKLLARAGYHYALSIRPGIVGAKEDNDLLALPRIGVSHDCA